MYFDGSSVIVYTSTNDHIFSEGDMFTDKIELIISNRVATIGGKYLISKGIRTVSWYWIDYEGGLHKNTLNNVIYFTDSLFNILRATILAESMEDYEVTWFLTKRKYYIFNWDFGKYKNTIAHSENCLPEL